MLIKINEFLEVVDISVQFVDKGTEFLFVSLPVNDREAQATNCVSVKFEKLRVCWNEISASHTITL